MQNSLRSLVKTLLLLSLHFAVACGGYPSSDEELPAEKINAHEETSTGACPMAADQSKSEPSPSSTAATAPLQEARAGESIPLGYASEADRAPASPERALSAPVSPTDVAEERIQQLLRRAQARRKRALDRREERRLSYERDSPGFETGALRPNYRELAKESSASAPSDDMATRQ